MQESSFSPTSPVFPLPSFHPTFPARFRFATLSSVKDAAGGRGRDSGGESGSSDDDEGRQGFYVGGSEHSGQQVLGPPPPGAHRDGDFASRFFDAARSAGAEVVPASESATGSASGGRAHGPFPTAGFRLGDAVQPSQLVGQAEGGPKVHPKELEVCMNMWENGFSIDDGPLRTFTDPENQDFLRNITQGRIPPELTRAHPGRMINLRMERRSEPYKAPKVKPFGGAGQRLGEVVPNVVMGGAAAAAASTAMTNVETSEDPSAVAQAEVQLRDGEPVTQVQVRLPDGQRLVARLNPSHTVDDLRSFIVSARPDLAFAPFQLLTTFPNKVIVDESVDLKTAGLLNAVVVLKAIV